MLEAAIEPAILAASWSEWIQYAANCKPSGGRMRGWGYRGRCASIPKPRRSHGEAKKVGSISGSGQRTAKRRLRLLKNITTTGGCRIHHCYSTQIVHVKEGEKYRPLGSGIVWSTSFALGVEKITDEQETRLRMMGVAFSPFERAENKRAGFKVLGFPKRFYRRWKTGDPSQVVRKFLK